MRSKCRINIRTTRLRRRIRALNALGCVERCSQPVTLLVTPTNPTSGTMERPHSPAHCLPPPLSENFVCIMYLCASSTIVATWSTISMFPRAVVIPTAYSPNDAPQCTTTYALWCNLVAIVLVAFQLFVLCIFELGRSKALFSRSKRANVILTLSFPLYDVSIQGRMPHDAPSSLSKRIWCICIPFFVIKLFVLCITSCFIVRGSHSTTWPTSNPWYYTMETLELPLHPLWMLIEMFAEFSFPFVWYLAVTHPWKCPGLARLSRRPVGTSETWCFQYNEWTSIQFIMQAAL